jgi:hypothetical protein
MDKPTVASEYPELGKQADGWNPNMFLPGSNKKVSWKCYLGHTWEARIVDRCKKNTGCPFCSSYKILPGFNDLETIFPDLARQANGWDPKQILPVATKKLSWKCSLGHIWDVSPNNRVSRNSSCPVCANRKIQVGFNDLQTKKPELAKEANGWDPTTVLSGSHTSLAWKCQKGHEWNASPHDRVKTGCPVCAGKKVQVGYNDLATTKPDLAKQAHGWDPRTLSAGSSKRVEWICEVGHIWEATPSNRRVTGCPYCANQKVQPGFNDFLSEYPDVAKQAFGWDPSQFSSGSNKPVAWRCDKGHIWKAPIARRVGRETGCPVCSNKKLVVGFNDLATTNPELAKQANGWDPTKVNAGSQKKVSWVCDFNHQWEATIQSRNKSGCPYCTGQKVLAGFNDLKHFYPEIAAEAAGWDPSTVSTGSNKSLAWVCQEGHHWKTTVSARTNRGNGCPTCGRHKVLSGFNDLQTTHPQIAKEAYGWDPTSVLSGSSKEYWWICEADHKWKAAPATRMRSGCPTCASYGYDPNEQGYLYLLEHPDWDMQQIGITNFPEKRLATHMKLGWEVMELRGPMDGFLTRDWETAILKYLKNHDAELGRESKIGKFTGYTEAWIKKTFPVESIRQLMDQIDAIE